MCTQRGMDYFLVPKRGFLFGLNSGPARACMRALRSSAHAGLTLLFCYYDMIVSRCGAKGYPTKFVGPDETPFGTRKIPFPAQGLSDSVTSRDRRKTVFFT